MPWHHRHRCSSPSPSISFADRSRLHRADQIPYQWCYLLQVAAILLSQQLLRHPEPEASETGPPWASCHGKEHLTEHIWQNIHRRGYSPLECSPVAFSFAPVAQYQLKLLGARLLTPPITSKASATPRYIDWFLCFPWLTAFKATRDVNLELHYHWPPVDNCLLVSRRAAGHACFDCRLDLDNISAVARVLQATRDRFEMHMLSNLLLDIPPSPVAGHNLPFAYWYRFLSLLLPVSAVVCTLGLHSSHSSAAPTGTLPSCDSRLPYLWLPLPFTSRLLSSSRSITFATPSSSILAWAHLVASSCLPDPSPFYIAQIALLSIAVSTVCAFWPGMLIQFGAVLLFVFLGRSGIVQLLISKHCTCWLCWLSEQGCFLLEEQQRLDCVDLAQSPPELLEVSPLWNVIGWFRCCSLRNSWNRHLLDCLPSWLALGSASSFASQAHSLAFALPPTIIATQSSLSHYPPSSPSSLVLYPYILPSLLSSALQALPAIYDTCSCWW